MMPIEILEDLFFIERGYLNANHFVYRSDNPVLIDTAYISDFDDTRARIEALGVKLSKINLIVSTHSHSDHIGGNKFIQDESGCDIAIHRIGKHFIDTRDDWATWWRYYGHEAEFFSATRVLDDGDRIAIGPHEFRIVYTPGHASDGIVLYNLKEKMLISSDTLWENDMPGMTLRVEGSTALFRFEQSLEKIKELDIRMVYPGHGRPFENAAEAIARSQKKIRNYLKNKELIGLDLLKKITIYTLLMHKGFSEDHFFDHLMQTHWFRETIELYFNGNYRDMYDEVVGGFLDRDIVKNENNLLITTVKP
jgi:glyoxylase-like metal-dependent hydrolase (beta-lactamase superfamily II)